MAETPVERRQFFRLFYPVTNQPKLIITGREYEVTELSEAAIVIRPDDHWRFTLGKLIGGTLCFHDGESLPLAGLVLRAEPKKAVIMLEPHLPTARLFKEQLELRRLRNGL